MTFEYLIDLSRKLNNQVQMRQNPNSSLYSFYGLQFTPAFNWMLVSKYLFNLAAQEQGLKAIVLNILH